MISHFITFAGSYSCHIKTAVDTITTVQHLQVNTEVPKIKAVNSVERVAKGDNFTINCEVLAGIPKPNIQWRFQDETIEPSETGVENLDLISVTSFSQGIYSCVAVNEYGSDKIEINLEVIDPPILIEGRAKLVK